MSMMTGKRKCKSKPNRKNNILTAKCGKLALSAAADAAVGEYVPATTDDNDICEVEWDSPRPLSGHLTETPLADIVAHLTTKRDSESDVLSSPPFQLLYCSPSANPYSQYLDNGIGSEPVGKQRVFNQAIMDQLIAAINECKQLEQTAADDTASTIGQQPVENSALLNGSSDELWTDTDDESFVRATQCVLDAAVNSFTSPMAVACSRAVTSTPNVKSSRCRRTFCIDPPPPVPHHVKTRPRGSTASSSVLVAPSSLLKDASFNDELLATLAEPDDVLDSQVQLTDAGAASEKKLSANYSSSTKRQDVCAGSTETEETCRSVAGHDSFLGDADPFAQPELYSLIADAEACATQNTTSSLPINLQQHNKKPTDCERSATASSSVVPVISKGVSSSAPKLICSEVRSKQVRTSSAASAKWCGDRRPVRQCSAEEIERKKQEALKRRRTLALKM